MYAKIEITGIIESKTGMHIGGSSQFAAIGAVDSPVIRDVWSNEPMIPGSSLKGKMRTLLARQYNENLVRNPNEDDEKILRLFGSSDPEKLHPSRLLFSDMMLSNGQDLRDMEVETTEVKFENTIDRLSAVANPRQIERSVRGAEYGLELVYNADHADQITEDFETLRDGMKLLEYDYLGGHGSRGYGKIAFRDLDVCCVIGDVADEILEQCREILKEVG